MVFQHQVEIGNDIIISEHRGIFLKHLSLCAISDLHIGLESGMFGMEMDVHIEEMLERIGKLIENYRPEKFVINGDLKHTFSGNVTEEWRGVPRILDYLSEITELLIVRGNHDNFLLSIASRKNVKFAESFELKNFVFLHGHKEFSIENGKIYVLGHEHPAVKLSDKVGGYLKMPVFLWRENRFLLLPAFSPWTYGHELADREVLIPSLNFSDYLEADVIACTDYGLLRMPKLRDILYAGRL